MKYKQINKCDDCGECFEEDKWNEEKQDFECVYCGSINFRIISDEENVQNERLRRANAKLSTKE